MLHEQISWGNYPIDAMLKWALQMDQKLIDVVMPPGVLNLSVNYIFTIFSMRATLF